MVYNLFISHSWAYANEYERLVNLLDNSWLDWKNYSVPFYCSFDVNNKKRLREAIHDQMSHASCVLILAGVYSTYSEWINIEIDIALNDFSKPKKILAIEPYASQRTSTVVKNAADLIVRWSKSSIASAIEELCDSYW